MAKFDGNLIGHRESWVVKSHAVVPSTILFSMIEKNYVLMTQKYPFCRDCVQDSWQNLSWRSHPIFANEHTAYIPTLFCKLFEFFVLFSLYKKLFQCTQEWDWKASFLGQNWSLFFWLGKWVEMSWKQKKFTAIP